MTHHEHETSIDRPDDESRRRDQRFKRALAGLIIGSGVLAGGAYVTLDHVLSDSPDAHSAVPIDCWPDIPKTPLPPPVILSPDELRMDK
jgi:hypothetical protein